MEAARAWQARLAKPPGSLGKLEDIAVRLAGITGRVHNTLRDKRILVFCGDNGVVEEGIGSAPRTVTAAQAVNMTRYCTGMSAMARYFGDRVVVVDVGIADPYDCPEILCRKIASGHPESVPGAGHDPAGDDAGYPNRVGDGGGECPGWRGCAGNRRDGHRKHHHLRGGAVGFDGP